MPFNLKNAGTTYQQLVNRMLKDQTGRNIDVYGEELLIKSRNLAQHLEDLLEAFTMLT